MLIRIKNALGLRKGPDIKSWVSPEDVFLVSYPKSGNTWMRFLFANLIKPDPAEKIDFHNVDAYCPEVGRHRARILELRPPRYLKCHAEFAPEFTKVIYILRDGRDAYASYYHYLLPRLPPGTTFGEFLDKGLLIHPGRWSSHVRGWLKGRGGRPDFLLVRYEEMLADPLGELQRCSAFAGLAASEDRLAAAVKDSSFESMSEIEVSRGRPLAEEERLERFMRKGETGDWRRHFGPKELRIFDRREDTRLLAELGYPKA